MFISTTRNGIRMLFGLVLAAGLLKAAVGGDASVVVAPAPEGEELSKAYTVLVENQKVPVYIARVASANPALRWRAMDDKTNSANFYELASFGSFDMDGPVTVSVACKDPIQSARILPASAGITPTIAGGKISFQVPAPKPLTIEVNGHWTNALHLFANPPEKNAPRPGDTNVIYFGPGVHEITHLAVGDNQTVYLAGGAVVRGVIGPDEKFNISGYSGLKTYSPTISLRGTNIALRGRGILDGTRSTTHARNLVLVQGSDIHLEGVILRDSSTWNVPIRRSDRVSVQNIKILGYRANSDGIDICSSRDVTVEDCFLRTLDDLIVVKSDRGQGEVRRVVAKNCVLWNEVAHALSVGAELREKVEDVLFTDCDVIHDMGREWTLRVYHCDSAPVGKVRFENIRIEESPRLISLWIGKAVWTRDQEPGHIDGVSFKNIRATARPLQVELKGFDEKHVVENVLFQNVTVNGTPLKSGDVKMNGFVRSVRVEP